MGIKRIVDTSFWTDGKVDEFSPEDKYFMLYLLTNPFSKQLGIYEISVKQAAFQLGYSVDAFNVLLDRFENKYNMIVFAKDTSEIAILNFLRHSVMKGGKPVEDCIKKEMALVKNKKLISLVFERLYGRDDLNETVKKIVDEYIKENDIQNDNDNENENERTGNVSYHDSYHDSSTAVPAVNCQQIVDLYNSICVSFPSVRSISESRRKAIKARLNTYSVEDFETVFRNAEASSFLKGANGRDWQANFDWLIKDANMAKVLDGNYTDKGKGRKEVVPGWMKNERKSGLDDLARLERRLNGQKNGDDLDRAERTAGNDPDVAARAEALKQSLGG